MKSSAAPLAASLLIACAVVACDQADRETSILGWKVTSGWRVGGSENRQVSLADLYPFQVDAGPQRVFLLDQSTQRVYLLDSTGHVTDTLGRYGSGPGEFSAPWAITSHPAGGLTVVDLGARRLISWSRDLVLLDPVPIREQLNSPQLRFRDTDPTFFTMGTGPGGTREFQLVQVGLTSRSVLAAVARPPLRIADLPSCQARQISLTPFFAPTIHWDTRGSLLVVAASAGYMVDVYDGQDKIAELTRPVAPKKATEADALRAAENWKFNDCLVPPAEVIRATTYLETIPVIENVVLSPDSLVWVQRRSDSQGGLTIDLFKLSGQFLGALDSTIPFPAAFLDANKYVAIERDSLDVPSLVAYSIERTP